MRLFSILLIFNLIAFMACDTQTQNSNNFIPDPPQNLIKNADSAIMSLGKTLKTNLLAQMKSNGVDLAISFCSIEAMPLTEKTNLEFDGFILKRTSRKFRNSNNKPDSLELEAIKYFEAKLAKNGKLPENYLQKYIHEGKPTYRYYKPLKVGGPCLNCHGREENITSSVKQLLQERYPEDKATGYKLDEFRGLMRAEFNGLN